jgi:hypothetical protein
MHLAAQKDSEKTVRYDVVHVLTQVAARPRFRLATGSLWAEQHSNKALKHHDLVEKVGS